MQTISETKRYVFDLDNTLCLTLKNQDGTWNYADSKPIHERINLVNDLYESGNIIIIETARGSFSKTDWYEFTFNQLKSFGLNFHQLRSGVKFSADYFIDDKAINSEDFFSSGDRIF
jgi:hypothetical protein